MTICQVEITVRSSAFRGRCSDLDSPGAFGERIGPRFGNLHLPQNQGTPNQSAVLLVTLCATPGIVKEFHIANRARAAAAAIVGLTLTATGVLAAAPHPQAPTNAAAVSTLAQDNTALGGPNNNHGGAVSTLARGTNGGSGTTTTGTTNTDTTTGTQGAHGAAVSVVAQDPTKIGGPNNNHGGAVSIVARGTHGASATHGKSAGNSQAGTHPTSH
jgi:hypothetical protein